MMRGVVRHRGLRRRWRRSDSLVLVDCIFHSRMGWTGVSLLLLLHTESCVVVLLFRSAFRAGDPVIPFFLLAGSILFPLLRNITIQ